jgi:hypothetical protein
MSFIGKARMVGSALRRAALYVPRKISKKRSMNNQGTLIVTGPRTILNSKVAPALLAGLKPDSTEGGKYHITPRDDGNRSATGAPMVTGPNTEVTSFHIAEKDGGNRLAARLKFNTHTAREWNAVARWYWHLNPLAAIIRWLRGK